MGNMEDLGFDADQVEPRTGFEPLPDGDYRVLIMDSDWHTTKAGNGQYLKLQFEVLDGACKGRYLWLNLNLKNQSEKAVQIAQAELSAICRAVGVTKPKDSTDLHNKPLVVKVGRDKKDPEQNRIKEFMPTAMQGVKQRAAAVTPPDDGLPFR